MVAHQTEGVRLPTGLSAGFSNRFEEIVAVHVAQENILALIPRLMT